MNGSDQGPYPPVEPDRLQSSGLGGSRVGELSAGCAAAPRPAGMVHEAIDHNGSMLAGMDQINGRLHSLLERMTGPQPRNAIGRDSDKPEGAFHILTAQQNHMDEKLREMIGTIEQLESLV